MLGGSTNGADVLNNTESGFDEGRVFVGEGCGNDFMRVAGLVVGWYATV